MVDLITRLRKRSPEERSRFSLWAATLLTMLIAAMWLTSLLIGGGPSHTTGTSSAGTPASSLWRDMEQGMSAFIQSLKK